MPFQTVVRPHAFAVLFLLCTPLGSPTAQAPALSDEQIAAAIAQGLKLKQPMHVEIESALVVVRGPYGRIVTTAAEAARKYLSFTAADVTPEMSRRVVEIIVQPWASGRSWDASSPVEHIVIRQKGSAPVIQPLSVEPISRTWGNAMGGQIEGFGAIALFDVAALPEGDLEIVIIKNLREQVVRIKAEDRPYIK